MISKKISNFYKKGKRKYSKNRKRKYSKNRKRKYSKNRKRKYSKKKLIQGGTRPSQPSKKGQRSTPGVFHGQQEGVSAVKMQSIGSMEEKKRKQNLVSGAVAQTLNKYNYFISNIYPSIQGHHQGIHWIIKEEDYSAMNELLPEVEKVLTTEEERAKYKEISSNVNKYITIWKSTTREFRDAQRTRQYVCVNEIPVYNAPPNFDPRRMSWQYARSEEIINDIQIIPNMKQCDAVDAAVVNYQICNNYLKIHVHRHVFNDTAPELRAGMDVDEVLVTIGAFKAANTTLENEIDNRWPNLNENDKFKLNYISIKFPYFFNWFIGFKYKGALTQKVEEESRAGLAVHKIYIESEPYKSLLKVQLKILNSIEDSPPPDGLTTQQFTALELQKEFLTDRGNGKFLNKIIDIQKKLVMKETYDESLFPLNYIIGSIHLSELYPGAWVSPIHNMHALRQLPQDKRVELEETLSPQKLQILLQLSPRALQVLLQNVKTSATTIPQLVKGMQGYHDVLQQLHHYHSQQVFLKNIPLKEQIKLIELWNKNTMTIEELKLEVARYMPTPDDPNENDLGGGARQPPKTKTLKQELLAPLSPCAGVSAVDCDDTKYLISLTNLSLVPVNNVVEHSLMRLNSSVGVNNDVVSSLMPYIEIILDGIHDFGRGKYDINADQFSEYCNAISNDQFNRGRCKNWFKTGGLFKNFSEDNLFFPLVKMNSGDLISNGGIYSYDEEIQTSGGTGRAACALEDIRNKFVENNIYGGIKYDAGTGLRHLDGRGGTNIGKKDSYCVLANSPGAKVDPRTNTSPVPFKCCNQEPKPSSGKIINTICTIIDPSSGNTIPENHYNSTKNFVIDDIYNGYFKFLNDAPYADTGQIKFRPFLYKKKVRYAMYLNSAVANDEWDKAMEETPYTEKHEKCGWKLLDTVPLNKFREDLFEKDIFLCSCEGSIGSFSISNIVLALETYMEDSNNIAPEATLTYNDLRNKLMGTDKAKKDKKKQIYDPTLFIFLCKIHSKIVIKPGAKGVAAIIIRLGLTFKLIGDRGQAWWVWLHNKNNPDKRIILVTGDRMLMIFAISIGIPAVWSAGPGHNHGVHYYYFPNTDDFDIELQYLSANELPPILKAPSCLPYYKEINNADVLNINEFITHMDGVCNVLTITHPIVPGAAKATTTKWPSITSADVKELLYNSCWKFVEELLPIKKINEALTLYDETLYNVFWGFLSELMMDPDTGLLEKKSLDGYEHLIVKAESCVRRKDIKEEEELKHNMFYKRILCNKWTPMGFTKKRRTTKEQSNHAAKPKTCKDGDPPTGADEVINSINDFIERFITCWEPKVLKNDWVDRWSYGSRKRGDKHPAQTELDKMFGVIPEDDYKENERDTKTNRLELINKIKGFFLDEIKIKYLNHLNNYISAQVTTLFPALLPNSTTPVTAKGVITLSNSNATFKLQLKKQNDATKKMEDAKSAEFDGIVDQLKNKQENYFIQKITNGLIKLAKVPDRGLTHSDMDEGMKDDDDDDDDDDD